MTESATKVSCPARNPALVWGILNDADPAGHADLHTDLRMRASIRLSIASLALLGACSRSDAPSVPDDLKQDLARVGGGDVQLAGASASRMDVVSATEGLVGRKVIA